MTIVTISDENVVTDGIIIATTKCRCWISISDGAIAMTISNDFVIANDN